MLLFLGYRELVPDPGRQARERTAQAEHLVERGDHAGASIELSDPTERVSHATLQPGRALRFPIYDEQTGRLRGQLEHQAWEPLTPSADRIRVTQPRVDWLLGDGRAVTIMAATGDVTLDSDNLQDPVAATLVGDVRITLQRRPTLLDPDFDPTAASSAAPDASDASEDAAPDAKPADDAVTLTLDQLDVNIRDGIARSDGPLQVRGPDLEVDGVGLEVVWNDTLNRLERLRIERDGRMRVGLASGAAGEVTGSSRSNATAPQATTADGVNAPRDAGNDRRYQGYTVTLAQDVQVAQVAAIDALLPDPASSESAPSDRVERLMASLIAEQFELQFEVDVTPRRGAFDRAAVGADANASSPGPPIADGDASEATADPDPLDVDVPDPFSQQVQFLNVTWSGALEVNPRGVRVGADGARRRMLATGERVRLSRGDQLITCGALEARELGQRVWVRPGDRASVSILLGDQRALVARSAFVDAAGGSAQIFGPLALHPCDPDGNIITSRTILRAAHWAELDFNQSDRGQPAEDDATDADPTRLLATLDSSDAATGALRRAEFVGDVELLFEGRAVTAERVEAFFAAPDQRASASLEDQIERVVASERVVLRKLDPALYFTTGRSAQQLKCDAIDIQLVHDPARGETYPRTVQADGNVTLWDARRASETLSAAGARLEATFDSPDEIRTATIFGRGRTDAWVETPDLTALGSRIDLDLPADRITIPGNAWIQLASVSGMMGTPSENAQPLEVTCTDGLIYRPAPDDLRAEGVISVVRLTQNVVAQRGGESLRADTLDLWLAPQSPAAPGPPPESRALPVAAEAAPRSPAPDQSPPSKLAAANGATPADNTSDSPQPTSESAQPTEPGTRSRWIALASALSELAEPADSASNKSQPAAERSELPTDAIAVDVASRAQTGPDTTASRATGADPTVATASVARDERSSLLDTPPLEPRRMVAANAELRRSEVEPETGALTMYATLRAPQMDFDVPQRIMWATGGTEMLLTNHRLPAPETASARPETSNAPAPANADAAAGVPSGFMSNGPSQTAMKCDGPMSYAVGPEATPRTDFVALQGNVRMIHVSGREMASLDEMVPQLAQHPEMLVNMRSRNARLEADRVEAQFEVGGANANRAGYQLGAINASGNVYLRDRQGAGIREVHASQVEYDAPNQLVRVFGEQLNPARLYYTNAETGQFSAPAEGPQFTINLATSDVETGAMRGESVAPQSPRRPTTTDRPKPQRLR